MTSIWDVLHLRHDEGSLPGARRDPHKVALVLEGGGMRGVSSIGLAAGLAAAGLTSAFDSIHGSSAGACAATYFASGQSDLGGSIYFEDINNATFIDLTRPLRGRPIMDLDYLVDDVMVRRKPLDPAGIIGRPGFLNIVMTSYETGEAERVSSFTDGKDIRSAMRASAHLPVIAGKWADFRGKRYVDGGVVQQVALQSSLDVGSTHVLVLMTRKLEALRRKESSLGRSFELMMLSISYPPSLTQAYEKRAQMINQTMESITSNTVPGVDVDYLVPPPDAPSVGRLTRDGGALKQVFEACKRHAISRYEETSRLS